ncbi:hypothetical protein [Sphingobium boeckii]|uniref:Exonuclease VII small subunit n=1 Tax=Sphingobium boeckii TaxID=1082345 RepID=A0A7W9EDN5_9SPHN|nr:hypothetical protein [Sphingobium boeckii]MBB5685099.1 exonuclease VII small subunit [Sphingobium boeckii]
MTGGSRIIDFRRNGAENETATPDAIAPAEAAAHYHQEPETAFWEEDPAPSPWKDRIIASVSAILAGGWIGLVAWTGWTSLGGRMATPAEFAGIVAMGSAPLALIGVGYLLMMRGSKREARRFARTSGALRAESAWLEAVLNSVSTKIEENRASLAAQTTHLLTVGDEAAGRMKVLNEAMRGEVDSIGRQSQALKNAATAARADMSVLLADLPKAQVETRRVTENLRDAGLIAHENAGALEAQLSSLAMRGREADEIAGGAAQRLSAHMARMESTSEVAAARLEGAASQMTVAVDAALSRAADAVDEARKGMEAQGAAMLAMISQSQAALGRTGEDASAALNARIADINDGIVQLGQSLEMHETASREMTSAIQTAFAEVEQKMALLDTTGTQRTGELAQAIALLRGHAEQMTSTLQGGGAMADSLIQKSEALLTALDANARELDETLPAALTRLDSKIDHSRILLASVMPDAEKLEMTAVSASNRLNEAEEAIKRQSATIDAVIADMDKRIGDNRAAVEDLGKAIGLAGDEATRFAESAAPQLLDSLVRVRETALQASERARDSLAAIIPDTAAALAKASDEAMGDTIKTRVEAQMAEISAAADRAVDAAHAASERLMRQMLTIADTSAQVESRIEDAREEVRTANTDSFARRVALLIESLNSTAIDVTKILSNDVTDSAWAAYLKGDRGVFTRRAVRLLDAGEVREIARHYDEDPEFREHVNRYIHDFEALLRNILATREGSPLSVTILSSDMGKLYVALAQAIERLRT